MNRVFALAAAFAAALAQPAPAQNPFSPGMRSVKIEADDFETSARFYMALGMKQGPKRDATWDLTWEGATQNSGIVLTTPEYARHAKMVKGGTYLMIMSDDVQAAAARLRAAGFADTPEPHAMGTMVSVLLIHDPVGNQIELMGPLPRK
jgi:predicted enzyme related to lactoylglutathione lyase